MNSSTAILNNLTPRRPALVAETTPQAVQNRILHRGDHLFRVGDQLGHAYLVIAGAFKSYKIHPDGDEQILGFYLPGDLIGFEALTHCKTTYGVVSLDTSNVRKLTPQSEPLSHKSQGDEVELVLAGMQQEILRLNNLLYLERNSAEGRVVAYLLQYGERQKERGCSGRRFRLPMRRRDLAIYLGLATETLSRIFGRLRDRGLLEVANSYITLVDHAGLLKLTQNVVAANGSVPGDPPVFMASHHYS